MRLSDVTKHAPYIIHDDDDSDDYGAVSSDEEVDMMTFNEEEAEDSDDFDKEMNAEVQKSMPIALKKKEKEAKKPKEDKFYDDVYFNSSDEESETVKKEDKKIKSNDELFYDPNLDDKDEKWMNKKRKNYLKPGSKGSTAGEAGATSATLSCPACMTVLCRDCQQHDTYHNQFRAMFVFNCLVLTGETLTYQVKENKKSRKRKRELEEKKEEGKDSGEEEYNPVKCVVCQTKVGVYDKEEIYHFFNVLAT